MRASWLTQRSQYVDFWRRKAAEDVRTRPTFARYALFEIEVADTVIAASLAPDYPSATKIIAASWR